MKKKLALLIAAALSVMTVPFAALSAANDTINVDQAYYLKNIYSGKYMQIASNQKHSAVIQNEYTGKTDQQFKFVKNADGSYAVLPIDNTALRFDINGASSKNGSKLQIFTENSAFARAQTFNLTNNGDGTYRLISKVTNTAEKVLEIAGPSKANGALLQIWDYVGGKNQKWTIVSTIDKAKEDEQIKNEENNDNDDNDDISSSNVADNVKLVTEKNEFSVDECLVQFNIENYSKFDILTTDAFKLQKNIDGRWRDYYAEEGEFSETRYGPKADSYISVTADLTDVSSAKLIEGKYRIIKTFYIKDTTTKFTKTLEFELKDIASSDVGDGTLRTSYFNKDSEFYQLTYCDASYRDSTYSSYEGDSYKIADIISNLLDIKGTAISTSRWKPELDFDKPLYEYYFESSDDEIRVSLYGVIGGVGYIALRRNGEVKVTLVVNKSDYNFMKNQIVTAINPSYLGS